MLPSERIKKLVEDSNIPYTELEKKTGISKSALQRYASGTTKKIPIDAVEAIADAFEVTSAYIMGWEKEKPATISDDGLDEDEKKLIAYFRGFNQEGQERTLNYVDDLYVSGKYSASTYKLASRDGKNKIELTPAQRKELGKVVDEAKKDDNSDLI